MLYNNCQSKFEVKILAHEKKKLGDIGESTAANYLLRKGYNIIVKNFRYGRNAEIDIIAEINDTIVFVEVKTRTNDKFGTPAEAVDNRKQQKIIMAAEKFLQVNNFFDRACRFDVIEVFADNYIDSNDWRINHIENAFEVI